MPTICSGAPLVTERNSLIKATTKLACSTSFSVCHLYVLARVILKPSGWTTSTPRRSCSFHVLPTENVPVEFIFALWMYPLPSLDLAIRM